MSETKPTAAQTKEPKRKIVFVCTGNTCRSPMAEVILKAYLKRKGMLSRFTVTSAGLHANAGEDMSGGAKEALRFLGYPAKKHKAKPLKPSLIHKCTVIICMTAGHKARIDGDNVYTVSELTGGADVGDPFGMNVEAYLSVARYLEYAMDDIVACAERIKGQ